MSTESDNSKNGSPRVSRRTFAKGSVAAGTAAVTLPKSLFGATPTATAPTTGTYGRTARVDARNENIGYGGRGAAPLTAPVAKKSSVNGWKEGLTIPAEYYVDPKHFVADETFVGENFWQYTDQASRIPNPGDFYVFEFGRAESILIVRGKDNEIRGFYNVCRHRGSRLCRHDADEIPSDPRLSVKQLGQAGSSPVFRCPYHAWTYDTEGSLIYAYGMQDDFDPADNGLLPCHTRVAEGQVFVNLSKSDTPPDFESAVSALRGEAPKYSLKDLQVGARETYKINANWKLALENFKECYHCGPAHTPLVTTHNWDNDVTDEQRAERAAAVAAWVPASQRRRRGNQDEGMDGGGMGHEGSYGSMSGMLNPNFVTGTLDGTQAAPWLPGRKEGDHRTTIATTAESTGYWQFYDDHVMVVRFTPRNHKLTDAEIVWLVHPDAVKGRDYDPEKVKALWHVTIQEDIWITDNNHDGCESGAYTAGRYGEHEGGPNSFVTWYMKEVVQAGD